MKNKCYDNDSIEFTLSLIWVIAASSIEIINIIALLTIPSIAIK